jgi:TolA-binding protein
MKPQVKLGLYAFLAIATLVFGILFGRSWRAANAPVPPVAATPAAPTAATNGVDESQAAEATNTVQAAEETEATNVVASGNAELPPERESVPLQAAPAVTARGFARVLLWGLLGVGSLVGLGALIAHDVSQYAGQRATQALFDDAGEDMPESLYDQVEKAYGEGEFLDAIRLLREFLKENPRGVHAQIRIAEIYEKDLHNPLAAALEYEEVLKERLDLERKGWTAIHLVNLYNRLGKPDQAVALMQKIVVECPDTPAAAKARERLAASGIEPEAPSPPAGPTPGGEPPSNLPPGFRPKA